MNNVIDFESKKKDLENPISIEGLNAGLKLISMPSVLKDNLAVHYQELSIKLQTIIDLLSNDKELSKEHWKVLEDLKQEMEVMASTDKHYVSILEAARKAGYYDD